jgi:hypothetical protein
VFTLFKQIRDAVNAGNYEEAGRLAWELVGQLAGWDGGGRTAAHDEEFDEKEFRRELGAFKKKVSAVRKPRGAGGAGILIALQILAQLAPLIEAWLKNRKTFPPPAEPANDAGQPA